MAVNSGCADLGEMTRQQADDDVMNIRTVFFLYAFPVFTGVIGNLALLALVTFNNRVSSKPTLFLISIAAADLVLSVVNGSYQINRYYRFIQPNELIGHLLCQLTAYAELTVQTVLVFSLLAVSVERFVVVCFPLRAKRIWTKARCRLVIACVWMSAMLVGLIEPLTKVAECLRSIITDENNKEEIEFICVYDGVGVRETVTWLRLCILFALPFAAMSVFYGAVIFRLWKSTDRQFYVRRGSARRSHRHASEAAAPRRASSTTTTCTVASTKWQMSEHITSIPQYGKRRHISSTGVSSISGSSVLSFASSLLSKMRSRSTSSDTLSGINDTTSVSPIITPAGEYLERRQRNGDIKRSRKRVMKMLLIVVATFVFSWGPKLTLDAALARVFTSLELDPTFHWNMTKSHSRLLNDSLHNARSDLLSDSGFDSFPNYEIRLEHARTYAISLMLFHSTLNPIIYVAFSSDFRAALCGKKGRRRK